MFVRAAMRRPGLLLHRERRGCWCIVCRSRKVNVGQAPKLDVDMDQISIASVWEAHSQANWPRLSNLNEGQLMTLDTVIGGCARYYLDSADGLDAARISILKDCIADLDNLIEDLKDEPLSYFSRLRLLAELLLASGGTG